MKTLRKIKNYIIGPISLLISILLLSSCMDKESPEQEDITIEEEIFWVYSYSFNAYDNQLPCDTSDNRHAFCLGISFNEEFDYDISTLAWISPEIEGYTRKSNFIQKIHVIKTEDSKSGQIKRKLVQVLEEERDYIDLLGGDLNFTVGSNSDVPPKS